jgi:hypothetical protein
MPSSQPYYRAVYAYPWDVVQPGVLEFRNLVSAQGLSAVSLAISYHTGKFLSPRRRPGRVYFPEDGAVYFNPTVSRYGKIKPYAHPDQELRQVAAKIAEITDLEEHAWAVLFHNTRLGSNYPDAVVRNAWGDSYIYSLCPVNPQVAEYGVALVNDVALTLPVKSVVVETPGFLPYPHGYHHEFAQVQNQPWLEMFLGLCFCNHCLQQSHGDTGIDSSGVRARVATMLDSYMESPCEVPSDMAYAWITADLLQDAELLTFLRWRMQRISALVRQMRAVLPRNVALAIIPTVQRPSATSWLEGSNLKELAEAADFLEIPFYQPAASRAIADAWDSVRRVGGDTAKIRAIIRPGPPDLDAGKETTAAIKGLADLGIRNFAFYNWGLLRKPDFMRIGEALRAVSR